LVLLGLALTLHASAALFFVNSLAGWSILVWAAGAAWLLGGFRLAWFCLPSIAFLFFMVPLPYRFSLALRAPLQRAATGISCWVLQSLGQPALAEGNIIVLESHRLEVEQACSGLRIFMGIVAIAFAYVLLTRRSWWERVLILASAVPVALVANSARIVVTGLLYRYVSTEAGKYFSHDISGFAMIPLAAALFAGVLWLMDRMFPEVESVDVGDMVARSRT
jgi:exosortase